MCVSLIAKFEQIIRAHMFQKQMKGLSMVMMTQMTELVKEDVIP
jgi:hypothetical protein